MVEDILEIRRRLSAAVDGHVVAAVRVCFLIDHEDGGLRRVPRRSRCVPPTVSECGSANVAGSVTDFFAALLATCMASTLDGSYLALVARRPVPRPVRCDARSP